VKFVPTHRITFRPTESGGARVFEVRLGDLGCAEQTDGASFWTHDPDNGWRYLGYRTPNGEPGELVVEDLVHCDGCSAELDDAAISQAVSGPDGRLVCAGCRNRQASTAAGIFEVIGARFAREVERTWAAVVVETSAGDVWLVAAAPPSARERWRAGEAVERLVMVQPFGDSPDAWLPPTLRGLTVEDVLPACEGRARELFLNRWRAGR
jgi:hypothetical protein